MNSPTKRRKAVGAKPNSAPERAPIPAVAVYGKLPGDLTQIRTSILRLVLTFGERIEDTSDVLIPLIDWQMYGFTSAHDADEDPQNPGEMITSHMLSFDNVAFLLQDLAFDVNEAVRLLAVQGQGGAPLVEERMRYTTRMLRQATKYLQNAADSLDAIFDPADDEIVDDR